MNFRKTLNGFLLVFLAFFGSQVSANLLPWNAQAQSLVGATRETNLTMSFKTDGPALILTRMLDCSGYWNGFEFECADPDLGNNHFSFDNNIVSTSPFLLGQGLLIHLIDSGGPALDGNVLFAVFSGKVMEKYYDIVTDELLFQEVNFSASHEADPCTPANPCDPPVNVPEPGMLALVLAALLLLARSQWSKTVQFRRVRMQA